MDSNSTTEHTLRFGAYSILAICAAVFIGRIAWFALHLVAAGAQK